MPKQTIIFDNEKFVFDETKTTTVSNKILQHLIKLAETNPQTIELCNAKKKPFTVVSRPGRPGLMWGVGGCGVGG